MTKINKCALCGKEVEEKHTLFKNSKVLKGGICPNCYLDLDLHMPQLSWKEKDGKFY